MKIKFHQFLFCLLLLWIPFWSSAQNDNSLNFNTYNGIPYLDEEMVFDTISIKMDSVEMSYYDKIDKNVDPVLFLYFKWMPGYGTYEDFNISATHYRHNTSAPADTLVLGNYCHPAPYKIFSKYGMRRKRMHRGVDLAYPMGTPVVAAFDGMVRISKANAGGYGQLIVIRHPNNLETYYGHLSQRLVNPGQMVHAGDTIALGGSTGRSTGPHLHFETRYLGYDFNPTKIIDFDNFKLKVDTLYTSGFEVTSKNPVAEKSTNESKSKSNSSSGAVYHKVKRGENLGYIARKYHTTVSAIKKLNGLKGDFIREGQRLRVK